MLIFNEKFHTYTHSTKKIKYKGATTFLKCVEKPYDSDYWSSYKAVEAVLYVNRPKQWFLLKDLLNETKGKADHEKIKKEKINKFIQASPLKYTILSRKADFLDKWSKISKKALDRGTDIHKVKEQKYIDLLGNEDEIPFSHPTNSNGDKLSTPLTKFEPNKYYPEVIVYNDELELCGTIDLFMYEISPDGYIIIHINDWKTNAEINTENKFGEKLLHPVSHLDSCDYNKYRLQISFYYYLITLAFGEEKCIPGNIRFTHIDHFEIETPFKFSPLLKEIKDIIKTHHKK